jgi:DNA ligase 1
MAKEIVADEELADGESVQVLGSGNSRYTLKNTGGVYSCSCPAWRNQSIAIEKRTCKHLRGLRGEEAEEARVGAAAVAKATAKKKATTKKKGAAGGIESEEVAVAEPPLLLAHPWEGDVDLAGWWMSEKLDGVRAYWDGAQFLSRLGNVFHAPDWFLEKMPKTPLDGELWCGRKKFQRTVSIVRRQDKGAAWREVSYVVFDAPAEKSAFEDRLALIEKTIKKLALPHLFAHAHERCRDVEHLKAELARVEALGGEGLMVRRPGSHYEVGRSSSLLKVKSFKDAEAKIIEHLAGTGRHKGRMGALLVEMPNGTQFSIGTGFSDKERESPPKRGAIITYRYQELSDAGVPRFPSYVGERHDVDWAQLKRKPQGS